MLPQGFQAQSSGEASRALASAGFLSARCRRRRRPPRWSSPAGPNGATTKLSIPIVALPKEPGRNALTLPPVPIAIARASGEIVTVCTAPHHVIVEDPTASTPDAAPRPNPPPRMQREEWMLAKQLTIGALVGGALAALLALLVLRTCEAAARASPSSAAATVGGRVRRAVRRAPCGAGSRGPLRGTLRSRLRRPAQILRVDATGSTAWRPPPAR